VILCPTSQVDRNVEEASPRINSRASRCSNEFTSWAAAAEERATRYNPSRCSLRY
jgi:hypothetical protein